MSYLGTETDPYIGMLQSMQWVTPRHINVLFTILAFWAPLCILFGLLDMGGFTIGEEEQIGLLLLTY